MKKLLYSSLALALATTFTLPANFTQAQNEVDLKPFHRIFNPQIGDHFYPTDPGERENAINNHGYGYEYLMGSLHANQVATTTPLFRLWNPDNTDHFYTTNMAERDAAVNQHGYVFESVAGYIHTVSQVGTEPLYRLWNGSIGDHFYTDSQAERDRAVNEHGYVFEGITGYLNTQPLERNTTFEGGVQSRDETVMAAEMESQVQIGALGSQFTTKTDTEAADDIAEVVEGDGFVSFSQEQSETHDLRNYSSELRDYVIGLTEAKPGGDKSMVAYHLNEARMIDKVIISENICFAVDNISCN